MQPIEAAAKGLMVAEPSRHHRRLEKAKETYQFDSQFANPSALAQATAAETIDTARSDPTYGQPTHAAARRSMRQYDSNVTAERTARDNQMLAETYSESTRRAEAKRQDAIRRHADRERDKTQ